MFKTYITQNIFYHQYVTSCSKHTKHLLIRNRVTCVVEVFNISLQLPFNSLDHKRLLLGEPSLMLFLFQFYCLCFYIFGRLPCLTSEHKVWTMMSRPVCCPYSGTLLRSHFDFELYLSFLYSQNGPLNLVLSPTPFLMCIDFNNSHN